MNSELTREWREWHNIIVYETGRPPHASHGRIPSSPLQPTVEQAELDGYPARAKPLGKRHDLISSRTRPLHVPSSGIRQGQA